MAATASLLLRQVADHFYGSVKSRLRPFDRRPTMRFFGSPKRAPEIVTAGRFEIERDGHVAYMEYTVAGNVLALLHTEVPTALRGTGMASLLAQTALDWAREHHMKVDIICPFASEFFRNHPEYSDLIMR